jgi:DNA processing protein
MSMSGARPSLLTDAQRLDWLRLIRSDNVGPRTFRALINRYGGAAAALDALPGLIREHMGARKIRLASSDDCAREIELTHKAGARFVALGEPDYPAALRAIDAPPPLIAVKGNTAVLERPMIAIVGSRNASAAGLTLTERLAHDFAMQDYVVVSGLARGIDQKAHRATIQTGTVAVLAGGLDRIYPSEHRGLADEICAQGALISEMPFAWEPRGRDFPRRNRIVSGLALGTVVVEAARRSGSLITARFANEQGREVFAVPGSPLDPRAEGTNDLLRQGATFCTRAEDVLDALAPLRAGGIPEVRLVEEGGGVDQAEEPLWDETDLLGTPDVPLTMQGLEFDEPAAPAPRDSAPVREPARSPVSVESLLGTAPVQIDDLVRASAAPVAEVQAAILDLELQGRIQRHGGGLISLIPAER